MFSWRRVLARSKAFLRDSWLVALSLTSLWWIIPNPVSPAFDEAISAWSPAPGTAGPVVLWAFTTIVLWIVASVGLRQSFVLFLAGSETDEAAKRLPERRPTRRELSLLSLRFVSGFVLIFGLILLANAVILSLLGLMILPATRVDGELLFATYVAPSVIPLLFFLIRAICGLVPEAILQHGRTLSQAFREGLILFRQRPYAVCAMTIVLHISFLIEPATVAISCDLIVAGRTGAALVRTVALILWISFYHEVRLASEQDLE